KQRSRNCTATITQRSYLRGTPRRRGPEAGFQLSSMYALSLGWGDYAREFVRTHKKPQLLRNFVNGWEGRTWEPRKSKTLPEQLGERLGVDTLKRGHVPDEAAYITIGIDKQGADGGFYPFVVLAHGEQQRSWLVQWGEAADTGELMSEILTQAWPAIESTDDEVPTGYPLPASLALLDSGYGTKDVYDFCADKRYVLPAKGGAGDAPYRVVRLGGGRDKTTRVAASTSDVEAGYTTLVHVNVDFWESEIQARLDDRLPGEPGSLSIPLDAGRDIDLCMQLLNGVQADKVDARENAKLLWVKRDVNVPNDYRDCLRMALCAAYIVVKERGDRLPLRATPNMAAAARPRRGACVNAGDGRPDGRPWL
ncbi:MAG TPA: terminase gpA endonuclease subunit, partial [Pirellulales bacterium]|nr:terminase gpA endonuclease subunit [Pirellulales bacterium]